MHFPGCFTAKTWELVKQGAVSHRPTARVILKHTFLKSEESKHFEMEHTFTDLIAQPKGIKLVCNMKLHHSTKTSIIKLTYSLLLMHLGR